MKTYSIIFLLWASTLSAQKYDADCKANLVKYVKTMSAMREPAGKKVYHMNYSIETIYNPGKSASASKYVKADILVAKSKSFYETDLMNMYADDKNGFLVLPIQRKIIWGPGGKNLAAEKN